MAKDKPYITKPGEAKELAKHGAKVVDEVKSALGKSELQFGDVDKYFKTVKEIGEFELSPGDVISEDDIAARKEIIKDKSIQVKVDKLQDLLATKKSYTSEEISKRMVERGLDSGPLISDKGGVGPSAENEANYSKTRYQYNHRAGTSVAVLNNEPLMLWDTFSDFGISGDPENVIRQGGQAVSESVLRKKEIMHPHPSGYKKPVYDAASGEFIYTRVAKEASGMQIGHSVMAKKKQDWIDADRPYLFWSDADGIARGLTSPIPQRQNTFGTLESGKKIKIYDHNSINSDIRKGIVPEKARIQKSHMNVSRQGAMNVFNVKNDYFKVLFDGKKYSKDEFYENELFKLSDGKVSEKGGFKVPTEYGNWGNFYCTPTCNLDNAFEIDSRIMYDVAKMVKPCAKCNRPDWWMDFDDSKSFKSQRTTCAECANKKIIKPKQTKDRRLITGNWREKKTATRGKRTAAEIQSGFRTEKRGLQREAQMRFRPDQTRKMSGGIWYEWDKTTISGLLAKGVTQPRIGSMTSAEAAAKKAGVTGVIAGSSRSNRISNSAVDDFLKQVFG